MALSPEGHPGVSGGWTGPAKCSDLLPAQRRLVRVGPTWRLLPSSCWLRGFRPCFPVAAPCLPGPHPAGLAAPVSACHQPRPFWAVPLGHGAGGLSPQGGGDGSGSVQLTRVSRSLRVGLETAVLTCVMGPCGCPPHSLPQASRGGPWIGWGHYPNFTGGETDRKSTRLNSSH